MTSQGWKRRAATAALLACLAAGGVLTPACGSATDPSPTLGVTCPLPITAESLTGAPVTVTYETPTAVGGTSPVNVSCVPPSGTAFSLGTTNVTCTARDAKQKTAACSFGVSVVRVPPLNVTRFMAFGDSITFGTPSTPCAGTTAA
ncbi:MAG TPA: HYR domain-containing protein, partial [Vicinamibacterales bacterium]|nr:HYR domain-containing protein [Vicinamibacterales bacterium]